MRSPIETKARDLRNAYVHILNDHFNPRQPLKVCKADELLLQLGTEKADALLHMAFLNMPGSLAILQAACELLIEMGSALLTSSDELDLAFAELENEIKKPFIGLSIHDESAFA